MNISINYLVYSFIELYFSTTAVELHVVVIFLVFWDGETHPPDGGSTWWIVHVTMSMT